MRHYFAAAALAVALCVCVPAGAATTAHPAYRSVIFSQCFPWQDGLVIEFAVDEQQCRAKYGKQWRQKCATSLGRGGDTVQGVEMSPRLPGYWQWRDGTSMVFILEDGKSLSPNTRYSINLEKLYRPASTVLDKQQASLVTMPLAARMTQGKLWIDPSPKGLHRLAASLQFNYPLPAGHEPAIRLIAPAGTIFGHSEAVWTRERDQLNISWPARELPQTTQEAGIAISGMGQFVLDDGNPRYYSPDPKQDASIFRIVVPGTKNLFEIKSAKTRLDYDDNLNRVLVLDLETSLYASPEEIAGHLHIWQLPKYNSRGADRPYNWQLAPAVPQSALNAARKINAVSLQKDNSPVAKMSFRLPADAGSYLLLALEKGCPAASGQTLARAFRTVLKASEANPVLGFLQPGNVYPLAGKAILDLYASGLDKISWQAQFVREPFLALLAGEDAFNEPLARSGLDMSQVSDGMRGELPLTSNGAAGGQFAALDLTPMLAREGANDACGLVRISLAGIKDGKEVAWESRLVLATRTGLLVKRASNGNYECFAYDLRNGKPIERARIDILGANGKSVAENYTDDLGHASFAFHSTAPETRPVAVAVRYNGSLGWLPLNDRARELNYSDFNVGGVHTSQDGLNTSVFSQRGLYRPGDTVHFGCITRRADFKLMPADMPLEADLSDPLGRTIFRKKFVSGQNGFATIEWKAPESAFSGRYTLNIRPAGSREILGSAIVRIEEFQPDTLKLRVALPEVKGWLRTDGKIDDKIGIRLANLYGTPAPGHKVKVSLLSSPASFRFAGYDDYTFTDAAPMPGHGKSMDLPVTKTNDKGEAEFALPQNFASGSSARITALAEGFEAGGGRAVSSSASILVSPLDALLGYKTLGSLTNLRFIPQNQKAEVRFMALNPELKPVPIENLLFSIARRRYVSSLVSDGSGGYHYDETPLDVPIQETSHKLPEGGLDYSLPTAHPGEFLLSVRDKAGRILASLPFAVAGTEPLPPNSPLGSGKLRLRLDKKDYQPGENIKLALSLPYDGTGLITLERDGVEAFEWFTAKAGDYSASLEIPENFEGRGYIGVSYARSADSRDIHVSPLAYAVERFTANVKTRNMGLALEVPREISPGSTLKVELRAKNPGQAVVFAVDEGILQLSNFQTPSPLEDLLLNRALDVRTLQALDLLMPDHARMGQRLSAFGGGVEVQFGARFQNPFKRRNEPPVVYWSGIIDAGARPATVEIPIPDYYNGKMRIMAVGSASNSAGSIAQATTVVAPLVLTPQIPLAVSPGDNFRGALVLANTTDKELHVDLAAEFPNSLEPEGLLPKNVVLAPQNEYIAPFSVKALAEPGEATIAFKAAAGGRDYGRKASLSIRPPSPLMTTVQAGMTRESSLLPVNRKIYPHLAHSDVVVSAMPLPLARGFAEYLKAYPHGCTEQLVSKAFAQALLSKWPGFVDDAKERDKIIEAALGAIRSRFNGQGISLWQGGQADKLLTIYAADFMLALRENGFGCPDDLLEQVCNAVEDDAALNEAGLYGARKAAYAIWVLTREGRVTTQLVENLMRALNESALQNWRDDLAALFISASQREMHMPNALPMREVNIEPTGWFDDYAIAAMQMAIFARYLPENSVDSFAGKFFGSTIEAMNRNLYATFSASQGIRALMTINSANRTLLDNTRVACMDADGRQSMAANGALLFYETSMCDKYRLDLPPDSPDVFWQIATTGFNRDAARKTAHGIEIERQYLDGEGKPVDRFSLGDEIEVRIKVRAMQASLPDCVISDLLPGGLEMIIPPTNAGGLPKGIKFADRREDRMIVFADLSDQPLEFSYKTRAANEGRFGVAPISAQAMYDPAQYGNGESSVIIVSGNQ